MKDFDTNLNEDLNLLKNQRIDTFKKAIKDMIATTKAAYVKTDNKDPRIRHRLYSKEEIIRICERGDSVERAQLSEHMFNVSGLYKRIILHYATFCTYSWLLVPHITNRRWKIKEKAITKSYDDAADFCASFQIERKCTLFATSVLVKGAYYGLIHDNSDYVAIQDLPFDFCRSRFKNAQDIDIVEFSMAFFDTIMDENLRKEILKTYPKLIQKAYYKYKHHGGPKWIFLPPEIGIYFNFFEECPFFLDLIPLLDDLDDYKEIDKKRNLQSLKKILTQKVGTDGMRLVFEPEEAEEMHEGVLQMLRDNPDVDVVTTYNEINLLDLSSEDDDTTAVKDVQDLIYEAAGVSKELFCATTDAGLEMSLDNDLAMMMILSRKFAHFFTVLINNKFNSKKIKFKFLILPISYYNNDEYTSRAKDLAAFGYSFLTPILSTGIDQTSLADLKDLENELLELDEVLKPLQSAYTQSGKTNAITAAATKTVNTDEEKKADKDDDLEAQVKEKESEKDNEEAGGEN